MSSTQVEVKSASTPTTAPRQTGDLWRSFRESYDQLFDRFAKTVTPWNFYTPMLGGTATNPSETAWFSTPLPSVDLAEDDTCYTITAELPGMTAADVDVSIKGGSLVIKGEKLQESKKEDKNYYLCERSYGAFDRSFYLPEGVDRDHIKAEVANGILTVTLPKTEAAQGSVKKIDVKAA